MMTEAIPHLKEAGIKAGASIVNISSVNGKQSFGGTATYCASKAAVDMFTRCAAVDLAEVRHWCCSRKVYAHVHPSLASA